MPPRMGKITSDKREDVLYKILLRSIKRFYFKECWGSNSLLYSLSRNEEVKIFEKIDLIVHENFKDYFTQEDMKETPSLTILHESGFNLAKNKICNKNAALLLEVKIMVGSIIIRKNMKKYINRWNLRRVWEKYYEVIYKYSYQRLATLLKSKSLQLIFKRFFGSDDFKKMLENDDSLSQDKEAYKYRAERMVDYINNLE